MSKIGFAIYRETWFWPLNKFCFVGSLSLKWIFFNCILILSNLSSTNCMDLKNKKRIFHKQAITCWSLLYKHNFSPRKCFIWNNMNIIYRNKTLFIENWFKHDILLVSQLLNNSNQILTYDDFTHKFNIHPPRKEFDIVTRAIPHGIITLLRDETDLDQIKIYFSSSVSINGLYFLDWKVNNKVIKNLLRTKSIPASRYKWSPLYQNMNWNKAWSYPHTFLITNKVKEISFKIIHHYYPCNKIISKFIPTVDEKCSFCSLETETLDHLFYSCSHSSSLWNDIQWFIMDTLAQTYIYLILTSFFTFLTQTPLYNI